jgi:hypothetical protein
VAPVGHYQTLMLRVARDYVRDARGGGCRQETWLAVLNGGPRPDDGGTGP